MKCCIGCKYVIFLLSNAYTLVLHKQGKKLYDALKGVIKDHLLLEVYLIFAQSLLSQLVGPVLFLVTLMFCVGGWLYLYDIHTIVHVFINIIHAPYILRSVKMY